MKPRILAFAGSTREGSFNKQLIRIAAEGARAAGAEVTLIDLRDFPLPLYDGDLEQSSGIPELAVKLKQIFKDHHALMIASPEYNSSMSGVLKNTLDWVSRPAAGEKSLEAFQNKVALLYSASPGALGGMRGLVHLRSMLSNIKVMVLPEQLAIGNAAEALQSEEKHKAIKSMAGILVAIAGRLNAND